MCHQGLIGQSIAELNACNDAIETQAAGQEKSDQPVFHLSCVLLQVYPCLLPLVPQFWHLQQLASLISDEGLLHKLLGPGPARPSLHKVP